MVQRPRMTKQTYSHVFKSNSRVLKMQLQLVFFCISRLLKLGWGILVNLSAPCPMVIIPQFQNKIKHTIQPFDYLTHCQEQDQPDQQLSGMALRAELSGVEQYGSTVLATVVALFSHIMDHQPHAPVSIASISTLPSHINSLHLLMSSLLFNLYLNRLFQNRFEVI